jgi:hypothetical protein
MTPKPGPETLHRQACQLLEEALPSVAADEEARRESWPGEIERGELELDLEQRITEFLRLCLPVPEVPPEPQAPQPQYIRPPRPEPRPGGTIDLGYNLNPWYLVAWRALGQWIRRTWWGLGFQPRRYQQLIDRKRQIVSIDAPLSEAQATELSTIARQLGQQSPYRFTVEQQIHQHHLVRQLMDEIRAGECSWDQDTIIATAPLTDHNKT